MNILFLSNNPPVSDPLLREIIGWGDTSVQCSSDRIDTRFLADKGIDWIVSYCYMHLIPADVLNAVGHKAVNLHVSLLPWNRGADPNAWSFIDSTPKGATVHMIDPGVDSGAVVARKECFFDEQRETLASSYQYLHQVIRKLFLECFPPLAQGKLKPTPQSGTGSVHRDDDLRPFKAHMGTAFYGVPAAEVVRRYRAFLTERKGGSL